MDGQTQVKQLDSYNNTLIQEGWTMVGLVETIDDDSKTRLFGVYRRTESAVVADMVQQIEALKKERDAAREEARLAKHRVAQAEKYIAEITVDKASAAGERALEEKP